MEAVIGLPPNLFYSTSIPACLLIFRAGKPSARRNGVLFIDGSACFTKGRNQNQLSDDDVTAIVAAFRDSEAPGGPEHVQVRFVEHTEIKDNSWDLNIARYLRATAIQTATVPQALEQFAKAQAALRIAEDRLKERLKAAGYE